MIYSFSASSIRSGVCCIKNKTAAIRELNQNNAGTSCPSIYFVPALASKLATLAKKLPVAGRCFVCGHKGKSFELF
jgi:hypothetical protein